MNQCFSCKAALVQCTDCAAMDCTQCLLRVGHRCCKRCGLLITCHSSGICPRCVWTYDWITEHVAVGDYQTPNCLFDVVVDLNYPHNQAREGRVGVLGGVISAGVKDDPDFDLQPIAERILALLRETPHRRILFRCYAGVSRSVTMAALYLAEVRHMSPKDALSLIQEKRPQAQPNTGFLRLLA